MTFRSPILLAACALLVMLTLPAIYPPRIPTTETAMRVISSEREEGEREPESMDMLKWYQIQRTYGNPDVNINERLQAAYAQIRNTSQSSLSKLTQTAANAWTNMGPVNISGRIRALAIHPAKPNVIYAGAASGGVWKSTNSGLSWNPTSDFMSTLPIGALAIDPNNPDRIFAGTGEPCTFYSQPNALSAPQYYGNGLMRSDDGGATWTKLTWSSSSSAIHRIAIHPTSADTMIVASIESGGSGSLYKTTNGGSSWQRLMSGVATDVIYSPDNPSRVYAAFGDNSGAAMNGVYVSNNCGIRYSWTRLGVNFPAADSCGRIVMAVSPSSPGRIYAAVALAGSKVTTSGNDFLLVMSSNDSGTTWQRRIGAISNSFTNGQAFYDLAIAVKPDNPDFIMMGAVDVYRSTNGGSSFSINTDWKLRTSNINSPRYAHADHHAIMFKPGDANTIVIGCDGGIHITTNAGLGWTIKSDNLVTTQFYSCTYSPSSPAVLYGGTQDQSNMRMTAPGSSAWNYLGGGDGGNIALDPVNSSVFYIMINSDVYRTTDGGSSLTKFTTGLPTSEYAGWQPPIFLSPSDRTTLYLGAQHMYRTSNAPTGSASWVAISDYLTRRSSQFTSYISDATCTPSDARVMYVVTGDGKAWRSDNVTVTDPVWTDITTGLPSNRWFSDVSVSWTDPTKVFVAINGFGSGHAYMSANAGGTWKNITGNLPDIPANAIVQSRTDPNTLFIATDLGVWVTTDLGTTWEQMGTGLPNVVVWDVTISPDNTLIAATHGRGMWTTSAITSVEHGRTITDASRFTLFQNYPNPFNPSTTVTFTLTRTSSVQVTVYNAQGVRVRTLLNEVREAGTHNVSFDAGSLPGGVYLCEMEVNGMRQVRKMSLVK